MSRLVAGLVHGDHAVAFHGRLEGADGVDLGDPHLGGEGAQGLGAALAHVAVAADDGDLAGHHHVGGALDGVHQRLAAAVEVVELALGDAVVDVDGGELELAPLGHLVEAVDARGGLLGDALDGGELLLVPAGLGGVALLDGGEEHALLLAGRACPAPTGSSSALAPRWTSRVASPPSSRIMLARALGELEDAVGEVPVLREALALVGEDGDAGGGDGGRGVVLGREDVAARPAHLGAEGLQGLDQHGRLDGHVQGAGDARALAGAGSRRTPRGWPSGRASRPRRCGSPCGPSRPGRCRRRGNRGSVVGRGCGCGRAWRRS